MKRDWDMIRSILITAEESENIKTLLFSVEGDQASIRHHAWLLSEAGFIQLIAFDTVEPRIVMRWHGYEFLDSIRSNEVWKKVKDSAIERGIDLTVDLIAKLAARFTSELMGPG